jgi:hybrid cluster-associated redox disulfide protein
MEQTQPQLGDSVQEVLNKWPRAISVFQSFRTACIGCSFARFCTLEEVVSTYDLSSDSLLEKLKEAIQIPEQRSDK